MYLAIDRLTDQTVLVKRQALPSTAAGRELAAHSFLSAHPCPQVLLLLDHFVGQVPSADSQADSQFLCMVFPHCETDVWRVWKTPVGQQGLLGRERVADLLRGIFQELRTFMA